MVSLDPTYCNLIQFVPENSEICNRKEAADVSNTKSHTYISGEEIKDFYESLVNKQFGDVHECSVSEAGVPSDGGTEIKKISRQKKRKINTNALSEKPALGIASTSSSQQTPVLGVASTSSSQQTPVLGIASTSSSQQTPVLGVASTSSSQQTPALGVASTSSSQQTPALGVASTSSSQQTPALGVASTSSSQQTITREQRQYFQFLKSAQFGKFSDVQKLLKQGLNINHTDFYGWTAAMCAAREGHADIVDCLLQNGADVNMVNSDGHTAAILARNAGHLRLAEKLMHHDVSSAKITYQEQQEEESSKSYCQSCRTEFYPTHASSHETSVVHLLNSTCKHKKHFYYIPETNRGFQMLLRTGWEQDKGLGPKGEGCKYPVKTIFKQDRAGLGDKESGKKRAKVTHFDPNDVSAIRNQQCQNVARTVSARKSAQYAAKRLERKQKSLEQKLRIELNGNFIE